MTTLSVRLPKSLHEAARKAADLDDTSINQLLIVALAEKLSAIKSLGYLDERAARGSMERYREIMAKVPDVEPEECDRL
jgi:hypothetical protein